MHTARERPAAIDARRVELVLACLVAGGTFLLGPRLLVVPSLLVPTVADVLAGLGARRALVVHGAGGVDELTPAGPNLVYEVEGGEVRPGEIDPEDLGIPRCDPEDLSGGSPEENAAAIRAIFSGETGPRRDAVLLNAAAALIVAGMVEDLSEGLTLAEATVHSGTAADRLDALIQFSRHEGAKAS